MSKSLPILARRSIADLKVERATGLKGGWRRVSSSPAVWKELDPGLRRDDTARGSTAWG